MLTPETAEDLERLVGAAAPLAQRHPARLKLLPVLAAHADSEDQAAIGDEVERAQVLGGQGRMAEREEVDRGSEPDPTRSGGEAGQEN
jgi:hypothetical protein